MSFAIGSRSIASYETANTDTSSASPPGLRARQSWHHAPMRALVAAWVLALTCVAGAQAHGGGTHSGFASRVSTIEPFVPGLVVQVVGGHEQLSLANLTKKSIVVLDDGGRPLVRIGPGKTEVWDEPRIGWAGETPAREGLVRNWTIAATADGEPFEIVGFLGYRPPPGTTQPAGDDGSAAWVVVLGLTVGLAALAAATLLLRRRRSQA
jgi:hypothetical protein